ncbi:hypothetical protein ACQR1W_12760 [Bradyrhizobium sp. HKCCYLS1011]|uniref:hypothetical protein n=1 Tax=Bradyrhizobium sp. HKCCYLS1011 TaxID=3420733 RepID=UPI003EC00D0F
MPTSKQIEKLAALVGKNVPRTPPIGPNDELPPEYWDSVLGRASADARTSRLPIEAMRLAEIPHLLRVTCRRCKRTVEIQRVDSIRMYGPQATWRRVGQRLLDDTCEARTGRHEEDGCWPGYEST